MIWLKSFLEGIDCKEYVKEFFGTIGDSNVRSLEKSIPRAFVDILSSNFYEGSLQNWINNQLFCYTDGKSKETNTDELTWALCMGYVHPRDAMVVVVPDMKLPEECWITYEELTTKASKVKSNKGMSIKPRLSPSASYNEFKKAAFKTTLSSNTSNDLYFTDTVRVGPNGPIISKGKPERTGTVIIKTGKLPFLIREMSIEMLENSLKTIDSPRYVEAITNEINHKKGIKVSTEESGEVVIPRRRSIEGYTEIEVDAYIKFVKELNTPSEKEIKDILKEAEENEMYEVLKKSHKEKNPISNKKKMPEGYNPVRYEYLKANDELILDGNGNPIVILDKYADLPEFIQRDENFSWRNTNASLEVGLAELEEDQEMYDDRD